MFDYECPYCDKELKGSFGDNVYCSVCNKTYVTDYDYIGDNYEDYSLTAWLTGKEYNGMVDIPGEDKAL